ncbi:hypothetical protein SMACR_12867 [Sordaria macrospora]|uniref:Uncharacterized protein n=1 Tax=Sordaria macrospora TaxID=5147 RepID=A0A8S8ZMV3_SORMA|nr:hypothetical protein SMACR_12867 [Sordaria macrospora]WPJ59629.1 hypothetical protein SMAC4_12867 [Sordaria macrospora]
MVNRQTLESTGDWSLELMSVLARPSLQTCRRHGDREERWDATIAGCGVLERMRGSRRSIIEYVEIICMELGLSVCCC